MTCCILCSGGARSRRLPAGRSCTSPLAVILPSLAATNSKILAPLTTNPAITPKKGRSTLPLLRFHRPPTWIVDWLLNTVNWWPDEKYTSPWIHFVGLLRSTYLIINVYIFRKDLIILMCMCMCKEATCITMFKIKIFELIFNFKIKFFNL